MKRGFTLIELLIVIAVLGTLAVVVLIALNPVQQLARTRDSGRISAVTQMGRSMEAYGTVSGGTYPAGGSGCHTTAWVTNCLELTGEIQTVPAAIPYSSDASITTGCTGGNLEGGMCYKGAIDSFVVYSRAEAVSNTSQCGASTNAYFVYASGAGRGGLWCGAVEPPAGLLGSNPGWVQ